MLSYTNSANTNILTYDYTYDTMNRITKVYRKLGTGATSQTDSYVYDDFGNLESATIFGNEFSYTYDNTGNITRIDRTIGGVETTKNFTYDTTSGWRDRLVAVDGAELTYSDTAPGLPTVYQNGNTYQMTWDDYGRLGMLYNSTVGINSYQYDTNGLRTLKRSKNVNHYYYYDGDRLIAEKFGDKYLLFHYDENDSIYCIDYYNGSSFEKYYLYKNLQGDVVEIHNKYNTTVARYSYDAWGNVITVLNGNNNDISADTTHFANINPIRYRGYYYDVETKFYYLQSRYYDPANARFISADSLLAIDPANNGMNLFAYCGNDPVNRYDVGGMAWKELFLANFHYDNMVAIAFGYDTAAMGGFLLMMKPDDGGVYHAEFDCWQSKFGYNAFYDFVFDTFTNMSAVTFSFSYNGSGYTIWSWKGDYLNMGAGAELGIYSGSSGHRTVDKDLAMRMGMIVTYYGDRIIEYFPVEKQWWITSFNPDYLYPNVSKLTATFLVYFDNKGMYNAFKYSWGGDSRLTFFDYFQIVALQH